MFSEHFYPYAKNKDRKKSGRLYQPNSQKLEELERPVDVFSPALEIRNAGTSSGCFYPKLIFIVASY